MFSSGYGSVFQNQIRNIRKTSGLPKNDLCQMNTSNYPCTWTEFWNEYRRHCVLLAYEIASSPSFYPITAPCWGKKTPNMSYISGWGWGGRAETQPTQRMLITSVLSRPKPDHPLWIKGEIVSRLLIFHCPEMLGCSLSSGSCSGEIILGSSWAAESIFLLVVVRSPWLSLRSSPPKVNWSLQKKHDSFFVWWFFVKFVQDIVFTLRHSFLESEPWWNNVCS